VGGSRTELAESAGITVWGEPINRIAGVASNYMRQVAFVIFLMWIQIAASASWAQEDGDVQKSPYAPTADFHVTPGQGYAGLTSFRFDASLCTDERDSCRQLLKRWDYDGDGTWDTRFAHSNLSFYTFESPGTKYPRLLVKDNSGYLDSCQVATLEVAESCPPPGFTMTDINPFSPTLGQSFSLSDGHNHRLLLWFVKPSK